MEAIIYPKQENKKAFKLFGIETAIILVLVIVIAIVLNFLGIFSLSKISPTLFSWLPTNNSAKTTTATPTTTRGYFDPIRAAELSAAPNNPDTQEFKKETIDTKKLVSEVVLKSVALGNIQPLQGKGENDNNFTLFWSNWEEDGKKYSSMVQYDKNNNITVRKINFTINESFKNIETSKIKDISKKYIKIESPLGFKCSIMKEADKNINICESFWEEKDGSKKSISFLMADPKDSLYYCEFHKGAKEFSWKSCFSAFAQTGIR